MSLFQVLEDARVIEIEDVRLVQMDAGVSDVVQDGREVPISRRVVVLPAAVDSNPCPVTDAREGEAAVVLDGNWLRSKESTEEVLTSRHREHHG